MAENLEFKHIPLRNVSSRPNRDGCRSVTLDEPSYYPVHGSVRPIAIVDVPEAAFGAADKHGFIDFTLKKDDVVHYKDAHNGHLQANSSAENIYDSYYLASFYQDRYDKKVKLDRMQSATDDFAEDKGLATEVENDNEDVWE